MTQSIAGLQQQVTMDLFICILLRKVVHCTITALVCIQTYMLLGNLVKLWNAEMESTIPQAVHFMDSYHTIVIFGLESGEM
jgi:hypothetical protein